MSGYLEIWTVTTPQPGSAATLVYDGSDFPGVRKLMSRELTETSTYAYRVQAINGVEQGVLSPATITVVAREGSSAMHTVAFGAALSTSMAGVIPEEQVLETTGTTGQDFTLKLGASGQASALLTVGATAADLEAALNGLTFKYDGKDVTHTLSDVHVTRSSDTSVATAQARYMVSFRGNGGDVPMLIVTDGTGTATVAEYIREIGRAHV